MEILKHNYMERLEEKEDSEVVSSWIKRDMENIKENNLNEEMEPFLNKMVSAWVNRDLGKISKIITDNWNDH